MKKLANLKGVKALNRKEQRLIMGGSLGICTASCTGGGSVTCSGHECGAEDNYGCTSWCASGEVAEDKYCSGGIQ